MRICRVLIAIAFSMVVGCSPPLGPKQHRVCLSSPVSVEKSDAIWESLVSLGNESGAIVYDQSTQFRELEENEYLIRLLFRTDRIFPRYQIRVLINPSYGGSNVTVYGANPGRPEIFESIVQHLRQKFGFEIINEGEHGECAVDDA